MYLAGWAVRSASAGTLVLAFIRALILPSISPTKEALPGKQFPVGRKEQTPSEDNSICLASARSKKIKVCSGKRPVSTRQNTLRMLVSVRPAKEWTTPGLRRLALTAENNGKTRTRMALTIARQEFHSVVLNRGVLELMHDSCAASEINGEFPPVCTPCMQRDPENPVSAKPKSAHAT